MVSLPDGRVVEANQAFLEWNALEREAVVGRTTLELGLWADPAEHDETFRQLATQGRIVQLERRFRTKSGATATGLLSARSVEVAGRLCATINVVDMSEQERVRAALRATEQGLLESEELSRRVLAAMPDVVIRTDLTGRIAFVSDVAARLAGFLNNEALIGERIFSFLGSDDAQRAERNAQAMLTHPMGRQEYRLILKGGCTLDCDVSGEVLRRADGTPYGFVYIVRDVTAQRRTERELVRRNRELVLLNEVMAASSAGLAPSSTLDLVCQELALAFDLPQAAAVLLNEERTDACAVADYAGDDHPGLPPEDALLLWDDALAEMLARHPALIVAEDARDDPRLEGVRDVLARAGTVSLLAVPLLAGGQIVGGLVLGATTRRAFTDEEVNLARRIADQAASAVSRSRMAEAHRRVVAAIEQTPESIVITDTTGRILYVNPAFERVTGYGRAEVLGGNPRVLKSGRHNDAFYRELWTTIGSGAVWHGQINNRKKDGNLFTEDAVIAPVRDGEGAVTHFIGVKRDVTRELEVEEQLRQTQKMDCIGRLAGGIAHDFNNVLLAIGGHTELACQSLPGDHPTRANLLAIQDAVHQAGLVTKQLLALARREVVEPVVADVNGLIRQLAKMLERLIGDDIALVLQLAPEVGHIRAGAGQIEQVLLNLVVNARDAMPAGGCLTVRTERVVLGAGTPPPMGLDPGRCVSISVADTGTGIPDEIREHVFEPFFTTKERGRGTGLGLATCFGIVEQNRGHISFVSRAGVGTTFTVYLSCVDAALPVHPQADTTTGVDTILVVGDEAPVRGLMAGVLRRHGYRVLEMETVEQARSHVKADGSAVRLLIADGATVGPKEPPVVATLRSACPTARVLYVSDQPIVPSAEPSGSQPRVHVLRRPFGPADLAAKVREVLDAP